MGLLRSITFFALIAFQFLTHSALAEAYGLSYLRLGFCCYIHSVDYSTIFLAVVAVLVLVLVLHCLCLCSKKQRLQ